MGRGDMTDKQWELLQPHLPVTKKGRPIKNLRRSIDAIRWVLRTGAPWRDLPERYGPWRTASNTFYRWRNSGRWQQMLESIQSKAHTDGELGWFLHFLDSTVIRVHQHAAGARRYGRTLQETQQQEALGKSRGGWTTKVHMRCEEGGRPLHFVLSPGQAADINYARGLLTNGVVRTSGPGRPRWRPGKVVGDKAYNAGHFRRWLKSHGIGRVLPIFSNQRRRGPFDREAYRKRNRAERCFNRSKQFRRLATRYEKQASSYRAMWLIASALLWLFAPSMAIA